MKFADLLLENVSTSLTNAGTVTLIGAPSGYRTLAKAIDDGDLAIGDETTFKIADESGNWEFSTFRITDSTTLTRVTIHRTSNGNNLVVTFPTGPKTIMNSPNGEFMSSLVSSADPVVASLADLSVNYLPVVGPGGKSRISAADLANAISKEPSTLPALESAVVDSDQLLVLRSGEMKLALASALKTYSGGTAPADTTDPTAPTDLASSNVQETSFTITFTAGTDNVGVMRHEWSLDAVSWTQLASGATTFNVTGRTGSTQYNVRVRTVDTSGRTSTAASLLVTTAAPAGAGNTNPSMTGSINVTGQTSSGYTFSYTAASDAENNLDHYETSIDGGTTWTSNALNLSRTVSGRPASTTDQLRVRAHDTGGLISNVLSGTATTTAAAAPAYVARTTVTPGGAAISGTLWTATAGTWAGSSTDKYAAQASGPRIQIINSNTGLAPSAVKFVWGKSPTVAPTGVTYATVDLPIGATDNDAVHLASQGGVNTSGHYGGWTDGGGTAQAYYGVFNVSAGFYAWQAAARVTSHLRYLWIFPDDGSAPFVYDNGTGSAIGWQVNV